MTAAVGSAAPVQRCFRNAGQIYYGDVQERAQVGRPPLLLRHGLGLQVLTARTVLGEPVPWGRYEGAWKQDQITGSGIYRWYDGSVYEGNFLEGRPHGHGKFTWPEGSSYDGMWAQGEMTGQGTFFNKFTGISTHGVFHRNSIRTHEGVWYDIARQREEHRKARLSIGSAGPGVEARMPVVRCNPKELGVRMVEMLHEPTFLVPFILADSSCPLALDELQVPARAEAGPVSAAPLWCLEMGDRGCTPATTVHIAFAAAEKRRRRDVNQIFRSAIREALLSYRPFTLVFADEHGGEPGNPKDPTAAVGSVDDGEEAPSTWSLNEFFDRVSLPLDLFDLRHFDGSGGSEPFLPSERQGWRCSPGDAVTAPVALQQDAAAVLPPLLLPATVHLLNFALVSLRQVDSGLDKEGVRGHVARRFCGCVPLHRVGVIVVCAPPAAEAS